MFSQKNSGEKFVKLCWIPLQEHSCFWFEDRQLYQETALHTCLGLLVFSMHPISATMVDGVWTYIVSLTSYMATPCYFIDFVMLRIVLVTQVKKIDKFTFIPWRKKVQHLYLKPPKNCVLYSWVQFSYA